MIERKALVSKLIARIDITNASINIKFHQTQMYEGSKLKLSLAIPTNKAIPIPNSSTPSPKRIIGLVF